MSSPETNSNGFDLNESRAKITVQFDTYDKHRALMQSDLHTAVDRMFGAFKAYVDWKTKNGVGKVTHCESEVEAAQNQLEQLQILMRSAANSVGN